MPRGIPTLAEVEALAEAMREGVGLQFFRLRE